MKVSKMSTAEVAAEVAAEKLPRVGRNSIGTMRRDAVAVASFSKVAATEMLDNARTVSLYRWKTGSAHSYARGYQFANSLRAIQSA